MKKILIILDGASDLPDSSLGGKTPFELASTPNLDFFAKNGKMGYMYPINEGVVPGSDNSLVSLFGNDPKKCRRGIYEAVGAGFKLKKGDLAARINIGTIENLKNRKVIDRRAGRTLTNAEAEILLRDLNKNIELPFKFEIKNTVQHRGVLVLRGNFSEEISSIDNEWGGGDRECFRFSKSLDDKEKSRLTSSILNSLVEQSFKILNNHPLNKKRVKRGLLPANMIFLRGFGNQLPEVKKYGDWMSINSMPLEIGIAKIFGMKNFSFKYPKLKSIDAYDNLYFALNKSMKFSIKTIKKHFKDYSGCYIQFKETDIPGHDNKPYEKKNMIELIDKVFFRFLRNYVSGRDIKLVVTCDHSTPCKLKSHSADPVPVLVYGDGRDENLRFTERDSKKGSIGKIYGKDFIKKIGLNK
jgi:2,3-bisphosphoglycerate-independent phosphoglycerate mutase